MSTPQSSLSKTIRIDVLPRLTDPATHKPGRVDAFVPPAQVAAPAVSPIRPEDYLRFFENAYDATLITDPAGSFVNANRRVTELLGYDEQALQHVNFWHLVSGADASFMDTVRQSLASERFLRISAWCVRMDGTSFPAEIAVNQCISAQSTLFCFFIRDETLRTQAEAQLRTVQNAVTNASAGIGVAGLTGTILYANTALSTLFGEPNPKNLKGQHLKTLLDNNTLVQDLLAAVKEGQSALVEVAHPLPDGTTRCRHSSEVAGRADRHGALAGRHQRPPPRGTGRARGGA